MAKRPLDAANELQRGVRVKPSSPNLLHSFRQATQAATASPRLANCAKDHLSVPRLQHTAVLLPGEADDV